MREPDQKGAAAEAWIIDASRWPPAPAFLGAWLVKGMTPGEIQIHPDLPAITPRSAFHAAWDTWMLQVYHLRPVDGLPPAKLHYPTAEFELVTMALDPSQGPFDPDTLPENVPYMTPLDLVKQFDGCTDQQAVRLLGLMVKEICAGRMSPDFDYREAWNRTIDNYKAGLHQPD
jgi:hypothetical protein